DGDAVIPPVAPPGKSSYRHQLNDGDAKRFQVVQLLDHAVKGAFRAEGAHVEFVNDVVAQVQSAPGLIAPQKSIGINDGGGPVYTLGQQAGNRVGQRLVSVKQIEIAVPGVGGDAHAERAV